jgi:hypothetical protein
MKGAIHFLCAQLPSLSIQPPKSAISPSMLIWLFYCFDCLLSELDLSHPLVVSISALPSTISLRISSDGFYLGANGVQGVWAGGTIFFCVYSGQLNLSIPQKCCISINIDLLCSSFDCFLSELAFPHPLVGWFGCYCGTRGVSRVVQFIFCMHRGVAEEREGNGGVMTFVESRCLVWNAFDLSLHVKLE